MAESNSHFGIFRYLKAQFLPELKITLSKRESDVLRWTAEGKIPSEASMILKVSERTVNFHIKLDKQIERGQQTQQRLGPRCWECYINYLF